MDANDYDPSADQDIASVSDSDVNSDEIGRDPFEELASEFSERHRRGEMPSVEEYAAKYPDLAEEIRDLFPTIAAMEQLKERKAPAKPTLGGLPLEQLGDFRILGEIGRGGMGVVYEAEQVSLGRHVAVKVLPKQALLDERHLRRFEREAQTAAKLHHTNIVPVFGVGQQDGYHYIVMQFIPGVGLDEILVALRTMVLSDDSAQFRMDSSSRASHASHNAKALLQGNFSRNIPAGIVSSFTKNVRPGSSGTNPIGGTDATIEMPSVTSSPSLSGDTITESKPLDADNSKMLSTMDKEFYQSVARIGQQVADALAYAHEQGTLHRDIKPGNLLLDGTGTVWVADFGLAKLAEQENVSRTGDIVGTLSYMPPESFSGDVDARGDIYALGLTLYEMLALRPAYYGRDRAKLVKRITDGERPRLSKLNPSIPRDLETIVLKAIEQRPSDRYSSARDLEEDLTSFLTDMPIKARRMSVTEQFSRWCRKNKLVASLSAAVLTLLVISSVTFGVLHWKANVARQYAETQQELAEVQTQLAKDQRTRAEEAEKNAKEIAIVAIGELLNRFNDIFAERLPLSADQSLQTQLDEDLLTLTEDDEEGSDTTQPTAAAVSAAAITAETVVQAEGYLESFDTLAKRTGNNAAYAPIFAELTIRVGKLHRLLGNTKEALQYFDDGIAKYKDLLASTDDGPEASSIVGLVSAYNEKGDLIAFSSGRFEALSTYVESLVLLQRHEDLLADSPRAKYEQARTLFLMSVERLGRRRPSIGRGGPGGRGPGGRGGPDGRGGGRGGPEGRGGPNGPDQRGPNRPPANGGQRPPFDPERLNEVARKWWNTTENLEKAIEILKPLVDSGTNPAEYRYLLARCYTGLSLTNPMMFSQAPTQRKRQEYNLAAIKELEKLIAAEPDVADYQFEFAIANFFGMELHNYDADERAKVAGDIERIAKGIAKKNPGVSNYAMLLARAQLTLAESLDRQADAHSEENAQLSLQRRTLANKMLDLAYTTLQDARERFPESAKGGNGPFPSTREFENMRQRFQVKHTIAEARAMIEDGDQEQALELLRPIREQLQKNLSREANSVSRWELRKSQNQLFGIAAQLCRIELAVNGADAARKLAEQTKTDRISAIQKKRKVQKWDVWELDFHLARLLRSLGFEQDATELFAQIRNELRGELDVLQTIDPEKLISSSTERMRFHTAMQSHRLYEELLREVGDDDAISQLREQTSQFMRKIRGSGRGWGRNRERGRGGKEERPQRPQ